jgi:magnesium-transporting ATPase (P-type)
MQKLLIAIVTILVAISVVLCVLVFLYLKFWASHTEDTKQALSFTVVVLVASIPMVCDLFFFKQCHTLLLHLFFVFCQLTFFSQFPLSFVLQHLFSLS